MPGICISELKRFGIRQRYGSTRSRGIFSSELPMRFSPASETPVILLYIEDDPGSVAVIGSFHSRFVPGNRFNSAAQVVTPGVVSFAMSPSLYLRLC